MPYKGYANQFVTFNDKTPKQFKGCELLILRYRCEHEDRIIHRCEAHVGMPKINIPGKHHCKGMRMLDGAPPPPVKENEDCKDHRNREAQSQAAATKKDDQDSLNRRVCDDEEQEGVDALEYSQYC